MRDLIDGEAELNDDEDDESFDEEAGESRARKQKKILDDSSEEEEDDEDEEEARRVCLFSYMHAIFTGECNTYRPLTADSGRFHCR